jgi:hypothetical protein
MVMMVEQGDTSAKLIGFTLTGGTGTVWTDARQKALYREGGGVLCEVAGHGGSGLGGKGGGLIAFAPILFRNNIVWGNRQGVGGQIEQSKRQPPELRANLVQDGTAPGASLTRSPKFADTVHFLP